MYSAELGQTMPLWRRAIAAGTLVAAGVSLAHLESAGDHDRDQQIHSLQTQNKQQNDELQRVGRYMSALNNVDTQTLLGKSLLPIKRLPGYGTPVDPQAKAEFIKSAVKVVYQPKHAEFKYVAASCTGTKVLVNNQPRVLTAQHCFESENEQIFPGKGGDTGALDYINITAAAKDIYGVATNEKPVSQLTPYQPATAIAEDFTGRTDWALLRIKPGNPHFDAIPAIPIEQMLHTSPISGHEVALHSMPEASGDKPISATGIYIGQLASTENSNRNIDYVGINPSRGDKDTCNFGGSGFSALFQAGQVSGPLSTRSTLGYGEAMRIDQPDSGEAGVMERLHLESEFKLDLSEFTTICGFSAPEPQTVQKLEQQIENPTPLPHLTGFDYSQK